MKKGVGLERKMKGNLVNCLSIPFLIQYIGNWEKRIHDAIHLLYTDEFCMPTRVPMSRRVIWGKNRKKLYFYQISLCYSPMKPHTTSYTLYNWPRLMCYS